MLCYMCHQESSVMGFHALLVTGCQNTVKPNFCNLISFSKDYDSGIFNLNIKIIGIHGVCETVFDRSSNEIK